MNENPFRKKVFPRLKSIPFSWWKKIQQVAIRGVPDYLGCVNSVFVALEFKKDKHAKLTLLQEQNLKLVHAAKGYARVVYPENFENIYNDLLLISQHGSTIVPQLGEFEC